MTFQNRLTNEVLKSASDLTADAQFKIVELTANFNEGEIAAVGEGYGILQNHPENTGEAMTVTVDGQAKVVCGSGGLAIKDFVTSAASGYATKANSSATAKNVLGRCISSAASGNLAVVEMARQRVVGV